MIIKNIEQKIKLALIVSVLSVIGGVILAIVGFSYGAKISLQSSQQVYLIKDGISSIAEKANRDTSLEIEARATIHTFHRLFFTLPPDDQYIERTTNEALYLIDDSGIKQKNALLDKGFYADILSHSANFTILTDSIIMNKEAMTFTYYGKQRIEKKHSLTIRELITTGGLREISKTENNPFGYIIVDYRTISNRNLSQVQRQQW